jgi:hypothetical protein
MGPSRYAEVPETALSLSAALRDRSAWEQMFRQRHNPTPFHWLASPASPVRPLLGAGSALCSCNGRRARIQFSQGPLRSCLLRAFLLKRIPAIKLKLEFATHGRKETRSGMLALDCCDVFGLLLYDRAHKRSGRRNGNGSAPETN